MLDLSPQELNSSLPTLLDPASILALSSSANTTKVILVRHGRSTYNEQGKHQGCSDESVLTEKGYKTAYQTGIALKSIDIDVIYTSPLQRAQQTTQAIINARRNCNASLPPVLVADKLKEINVSTWQGLSYQYVKEHYPEEYFCWKNYPHQFKLIDQETKQEIFPVIDLYQEAQQFWQEILLQHEGKTILLVSHGGKNRALINTALGIKVDSYHYLQQCNCCINILEFSPLESRQGKLKALNLTAHLGKTLPKLKEGKQGLRLLLISDELAYQQLHQLAKFWQQESINFMLSYDCKHTELFTQCLFYQYSNFLHLKVSKNDFLKVWHQQILSGKIIKRWQAKSSLVTGLIAVDKTDFRKILEQISGSYGQVLTENGLSIIHYPYLDTHPRFQGMTSNALKAKS